MRAPGPRLDSFKRRRAAHTASHMSHLLLDERFRRIGRDRRWATAVYDLTDGRSRTFGELFDQYLDVGRLLGSLRVEPGDAVVALVGNRPTFFPLLAACMAARTAF